MTESKLTNAQLLKKAYAGETIEVKIELMKGMIGVLCLADIQEIAIKQADIQTERYLYYRDEKKYDKKPIDDPQWQKYVNGITDQKQRSKTAGEPPRDLADQLSQRDTRNIILSQLLPAQLKHPETGEPLFTPEEIPAVGRTILSTPSLAELLGNQIIEMTSKIDEIVKKAKN